VALFSQDLADQSLDPLPGWVIAEDDALAADGDRFPPEQALSLISGAAHHFVSSSFANQPAFLQREGDPFVEIHHLDAAARKIEDGDVVIVENGRGWCELRAVVTDKIRAGVLASPKGRWSKLGDGRNVNWMTSDALGDFAGQSTFHSSWVWLRKKRQSGNGQLK
jgi:anaerobic selenocysteine-containing dehydrogenase